jgi:hypothetical protein
MTAGDFNQDGRLDLAVTNQSDNTVSVVLSRPDGTFALRTDYAVGTAPVAIASGDFNGDKIPDLAVVNSKDSTVSILPGIGGGAFGKQTTFATGTTPVGIVAADFNGDGKVDLAVLNGVDGTVSVLAGNGDGTFANLTTVDSVATPIAILAGDFNGDGDVDIVTLNAAGDVTLLLNSGKGSFTAAGQLVSAGSAGGMTEGDFNNDGKLDFAIASPSDNSILVYLGNGDGTFKLVSVDGGEFPNPGDSGFTNFFNPVSITCGDFNGDGKLDLAASGGAAAYYPTNAAVYLGNGDGSFQKPQISRSPGTLGPVLTGDFNNDNFADLVEIDPLDDVVLISLGGALPTHADSTLPDSGGFGWGGVADFNGDGKLDAAAVQFTQSESTSGTEINTGFLTVLPGNGDGTFQAPVVTQLPQFGMGPVVIADFNGDGKPDVVMTDPALPATGAISVVLGNGDGTFGAAVSSPANVPDTNVQAIAAGDFNGDGKQDIALVSDGPVTDGSSIYVLLGNGDGTFQANFVSSFSSLANGIAVADFNHDGRPDLVVSSNAPNVVLVLLGQGNGTFSSPVSYSTGADYANSVVAADFNGDGKVDLAVESDQSILFFAGNGDGTFQASVKEALPIGVGVLYSGDFNGDGKPDIAYGAGYNNSIFLGNGDGTFQNAIGFVPTWYPRFSIGGDFNGDGSLELLEFSTDITLTGAVLQTATTWLSSPAASFSAPSLSFTAQDGSSSAPQTISLTNIGNGLLKVAKIATTSGFSETNNCPDTLKVGQGCAFSVSYAAGSGASSGALTLSDNAYPGMQVIPLSSPGGTPDFTLSATPASASVSAGASESYSISLNAVQGFTGTIELSCSGAPMQATCSVSPTSVTLSGQDSKSATLKVSTTATTAEVSHPRGSEEPVLAGFSVSGLFVLGASILTIRRRRWQTLLASTMAVVVLVFLMSACGRGPSETSSGSGSGGGTPPVAGTPSGTYSVVVSATSGNLTHTTTVSLVVK